MKPAKEPSLEPSGDAVKEAELVEKARRDSISAGAPRAPVPAPNRGPFARYLEGWELGVITVALVLAAALLAVPRAAPPGIFPVPLVDSAEAAETRRHLTALADRAEREGLPFETRAVGDAVRRSGSALSSGVGDPQHLNELMAERVRAALNAGQVEALVRLRAVQSRLFVRAVREQAWNRPASAELAALGGDFVQRAQRNGWVKSGQCVATDDELASLFARRWSELTRLRDDPHFKPTLGELRRYFRFLLLNPERGPGVDAPERERASLRLRYVEALARHDTEYPLALARGSLLAELGGAAESAQSLGAYLSRSPGDWNLRARNYLLFAARGRGAESGGTSSTEGL